MVTSTLIVRDATLAVNGAPESRREMREHLGHRVAEVSLMDERTTLECLSVLRPLAEGEGADPEVLLALTILGLGRPEVSRRLGISPIAPGRRLAARLEQLGDPQAARGVLEFLLEQHPGQTSLERDYAAVMRRQGMVQDLVQRYFDRASHLLREGKTHEAVGWLREILLLDRSRTDIARMIRDLRIRESRSQRWTRGFSRSVLVLLFFGGGLAWLVTREQRVREAYLALPQAREGDVASMRRRLAALEGFSAENLLWHGSFSVVSERSRLRVALDRFAQDGQGHDDQLALQLFERAEAAELARGRGLMHADSGNFQEALEDFQLALSLAPPDWSERERVERDIEALRKFLEGNP